MFILEPYINDKWNQLLLIFAAFFAGLPNTSFQMTIFLLFPDLFSRKQKICDAITITLPHSSSSLFQKNSFTMQQPGHIRQSRP